MKGIQIKINGQWIYLPEDFSISLEQTSPVFNEQGTFSFPFEIPLEPNRSVFKNIADPFGDISLRDIDKAPAEIWFAGVMLYRGIIEVDEEVELEDSIPVTFLSGNSDFMSRIEGMNCRDVPLDREIKLGYYLKSASITVVDHTDTVLATCYLGTELMNYEINVSDPYPIKPFCNARVCTPSDQGGYTVLEAQRPYSGVCFYVLYFLDCLFKNLNIGFNTDTLLAVEDMARLAFFSTTCYTEEKGDEFSINYKDLKNINKVFASMGILFTYERRGRDNKYVQYDTDNFSYKGKNLYATNKNFPNIDVKNVIEGLSSAFGIIFLFDNETNMMKAVFKKEVLTSSEIKSLDLQILDYNIVKSKYAGLKLTYGNDDDTAYNYDDYSNVVTEESFLEILQNGLASYDTTCYYDSTTGNSYRVKVDKNTGNEPQLFEVGGYRDCIVGEGKEEDMEELSTNFLPVIVNDVNGSEVLKKAMSGEEGQQKFAVFVGEELKSDKNVKQKLVPSLWGLPVSKLGNTKIYVDLTYQTDENYDRESNNESPLRDYDTGFTLGVMRGAGSEAGLETVDENYDGEGNASWVQTVAEYSFTADSCDNFGRYYDYNGTEEGGVDQDGRFSLKLIASKDGLPVDVNYKDRGLVSKFLSEYLYFMANKKTVVLTVRMNITQIIGIDFLKRYKIGDFLGFINKVSYTLDVNGVTDATIELYTL